MSVAPSPHLEEIDIQTRMVDPGGPTQSQDIPILQASPSVKLKVENFLEGSYSTPDPTPELVDRAGNNAKRSSNARNRNLNPFTYSSPIQFNPCTDVRNKAASDQAQSITENLILDENKTSNLIQKAVIETSTTLSYHEQMAKKENDKCNNLLNEVKYKVDAVNKEKKKEKKKK
jgi:hypothetical protein